MNAIAASWEAGARCRRLAWLLHACVVEAKHAQFILAFKAGFNPNQPRVPSGNPDGWQWTGGGGGGQTQVAQNLSRPARGSGLVRLRNGQLAEATPAQEARLAVAQARAEARAAEVRQLDPTWRPTPSFTETIEGEILAAESEAREAEGRLHELEQIGIGPGRFAGESLPARGPSRDFRVDERREINRVGSRTGCHTCGRTDPGTGSGNFVPDHQPPTSLNSSGRPQRLYPQCVHCSRTQGGSTTKLKGPRK
jgi:hypothetical protein